METNYSYFVIVNIFICYVGPLIIITICNISIWKRVKNRTLAKGVLLSNFRVFERSKIHVIKMVLLIIISFALLWLPLYVLFCFIQFSSREILNSPIGMYLFSSKGRKLRNYWYYFLFHYSATVYFIFLTICTIPCSS